MSDKLALLIRSKNPLISIQSIDEERAITRIEKVARLLNRPLYDWSLTTGLRICFNAAKEGYGKTLVEPGKTAEAIEYLLKADEQTIFLLRDFGPHCKDARVHRLLRDLISQHTNHERSTEPESATTVILVDSLPLPDEIRRFTIRYELDWPDHAELEKVVKATFRQIKKSTYHDVVSDITKKEVEHLIQSLRGLSTRDAERVVASAIYDDFALTPDDLPRIIESKRTLLGSAGCLETINADFDLDDIGGLANLKQWLNLRRQGYSKEAKEFGLESPRGVLMLGVSGCGKSLCAKVVAADWHMPLLRLDPGVLYQKYIGESESQLRQALAQAEAMAPAILWIDEIEKAFASAAAGSADGGLSKRMFGTLLSWMQDHRHPIFIIATANDISALPPELMRKGRFDEIFFIDLPTPEARKQIFEIHLRRRDREPDAFDLDELAIMSEGFGGSEIEQAVISSLFSAFSQKQELKTRHILEELKRTKPLSVIQHEKIAELRQWAEDRCVHAH